MGARSRNPVPRVGEVEEVQGAVLAAAFARLGATALGIAMATVSAVALWLAGAMLLVRGGAVVGPHL